jgi:capsular polysaccharide transport system permease protein
LDIDKQIITKEQHGADHAIPRLVMGTIARTSAAVVRSILGFVTPRTVTPTGEGEAPKARKLRPLPNGFLASFIAIVVFPSFICIVYLVFIASDQFVAEARFAVRRTQFELGPDVMAASRDQRLSIGHSFDGKMPMIANQDAYVIANYIGTRAIIDDLAGKIDIRAIFQRPEADFWARLKRNASAEELTNYWRKMVSTYVETTSGIVIVAVRTFRAADSKALVLAILDASEELANKVSARARMSVMRDAEAEVLRSRGLVRAALADMRKYRDAKGLIDPLSAATSTSTLLLETMSEKIQLENDYFVAAKAMSPEAPSVNSLKTRLEALDTQIAQLKSQLTGNSPEGHAISASLATFEELELKRMFSKKLYAMAQGALERAKLTAEEQNIYVTTFVPPSLPQEAEYPERLSLCLIMLFGFLILWGILAMLAASIEDHRN